MSKLSFYLPFFPPGGRCVLSCSVGSVLDHLLPTAPPTNQIRLTGGSNPNEGRVEVFHDGVWGTVCMNGWDLEDAEVSCLLFE